jgi:hypothetical protein
MVAAAALGAWTVYASMRLLSPGTPGDDASDVDGARWTWVALAFLATVAAVGRLPRVAWLAAGLAAVAYGAFTVVVLVARRRGLAGR